MIDWRFLLCGFVIGCLVGSWFMMVVREPWINRRYHDLEVMYFEMAQKSKKSARAYEDQLVANGRERMALEAKVAELTEQVNYMKRLLGK